jgi:hypothetical protein
MVGRRQAHNSCRVDEFIAWFVEPDANIHSVAHRKTAPPFRPQREARDDGLGRAGAIGHGTYGA